MQVLAGLADQALTVSAMLAPLLILWDAQNITSFLEMRFKMSLL